MRCAGLTLVIPEKHDAERASVAEAWRRAGGEVVTLGRFWEPPALDPASVRCYGNDTFCLVLAQKLNLTLISPADDFLRFVPPDLLKRALSFTTLAIALTLPFPAFVKPMTPKQFAGRVFNDADALRQETEGLPAETPVMISEIVEIVAEARTFVVNRRVASRAIYEGEASESMLAALRDLPTAAPDEEPIVIDWACIAGKGWAVLEANAAWGAGLNGCDPVAVLPCIERATRSA
jgi:ATP-grasp domain-containing protein